MIFLIVFSRKRGLIAGSQFADDDRARAEESRQQAIREHLTELDDVEIALFESDSLDTLKKTHARYFKSPSDMFNDINLERTA